MSLTILIADDAMAERLPLVRELEDAGHDVRYALSAAEVSAYVAGEALDVALVSQAIAADCGAALASCASDHDVRHGNPRNVRILVFGSSAATRFTSDAH